MLFADFYEIFLPDKRFSAGNGDTAAVLIEALVTVILLEDILCLHIGATRHLPGIRVMTVSTSHGAAFKKYNEPCAGSVYGSEAFKRMNVTYHLILLLKTGPKRKLSGPYRVILFQSLGLLRYFVTSAIRQTFAIRKFTL